MSKVWFDNAKSVHLCLARIEANGFDVLCNIGYLDLSHLLWTTFGMQGVWKGRVSDSEDVGGGGHDVVDSGPCGLGGRQLGR